METRSPDPAGDRYIPAWERARTAGSTVLPGRSRQRLPRPLAALVLGSAAAMRWSGAGGVHQLRVNLAQVLGQAADSPAVAARGVHSYPRYWREFFGLAGWSLDRIRDAVVFEWLDPVAAARDAGRGVVLGAAAQRQRGPGRSHAGAERAPVRHGVAQRLRPERLYQRFVSHRAALGVEVLPAE
jgi:phosphatidylinositol dimannoside acyltransferase